MKPLDGTAVVYCDGAFNTPNGKTAHGLVRFTRRYHVAAVIDSRHAGQDAGTVLDRRPSGIPLVASLEAGLQTARAAGTPASHLVIGIAPDGGRIDEGMRWAIREALSRGLHVDSGLHDFVSDDAELAGLAAQHGARIRDIRKPPPRSELHFFSGKIEHVDSCVIAVLGTDSAVGKRTTAWKLVQELEARGHGVQMIGTGQTAWMQGAKHSFVLDSLINDFVAGEIEHAVWSAWSESRPEFIVLEGQGSLMNPAYPGGFELLAAGRPQAVIMQHAPTRTEYDGFPGYKMHPLTQQIDVLQRLSGKPVIAVTVNHEGIAPEDIQAACEAVSEECGLPAFDVLEHGAAGLADVVLAARNG
ncbi:MAG: DUF1611 domain-containing protein [Rhodothermales bacterium]|nr:DUF1611 domain-containing protein [Rhodothermales bacterium]MBO6778111.1 DUF1611 domain-containing protein [Rhodothermales bacterium]